MAGASNITFYLSSVLGQDTAMMSQAIAGALEIYGMSLDILAQKAPRRSSGLASPFQITTWPSGTNVALEEASLVAGNIPGGILLAGAPRVDRWLGIQSQTKLFTSQFPTHRNREFIWG